MASIHRSRASQSKTHLTLRKGKRLTEIKLGKKTVGLVLTSLVPYVLQKEGFKNA